MVIELKDKAFKPGYAGKMNFYLSAVDDLIKHETDRPSIGLILCKTKNNVLAEYTLRDMAKPISLAEYRLEDALPNDVKTALPTIEALGHATNQKIRYYLFKEYEQLSNVNCDGRSTTFKFVLSETYISL